MDQGRNYITVALLATFKCFKNQQQLQPLHNTENSLQKFATQKEKIFQLAPTSIFAFVTAVHSDYTIGLLICVHSQKPYDLSMQGMELS